MPVGSLDDIWPDNRRIVNMAKVPVIDFSFD